MTASRVADRVVEEATLGAAAGGDPADPIERDDYGRPILTTPDGKRIGHTRASGVGKPLEDTYRLELWKQRQVVAGLRELLAAGIFVELDDLGDEPDRDDVEAHRAWKASMDDVVERAHVAAGSKDRADLGTYLHDVLDARFHGHDLPPIPERFAARYTLAQRERDLAAVDAATAGMRELCRERFVVNDAWTVAGTLDSLVLIPLPLLAERTTALRQRVAGSRMRAENRRTVLAWLDRRLDAYAAWQAQGVLFALLVGDTKSGRNEFFGGLAHTAQCAAYADAVFYDPATGERTPLTSVLPDDVDPATVRVDRETAIIVHVPVGEGRCTIHDVPLDEGRAAIAMASDIKAMRSASKRWLQVSHEVEAPRPADAVEPVPASGRTPDPQTGVASAGGVDLVVDQIAACRSIDELLAVRVKWMTPIDYGKPGPDGVHVPRPVVHWTDAHEAAAAFKAEQLKPTADQVPAPVAQARAALPDGPANDPWASDPILAEIEQAQDMDDLKAVWSAHSGAGWTPEHDAAAAAKAERFRQAAA